MQTRLQSSKYDPRRALVRQPLAAAQQGSVAKSAMNLHCANWHRLCPRPTAAHNPHTKMFLGCWAWRQYIQQPLKATQGSLHNLTLAPQIRHSCDAVSSLQTHWHAQASSAAATLHSSRSLTTPCSSRQQSKRATNDEFYEQPVTCEAAMPRATSSNTALPSGQAACAATAERPMNEPSVIQRTLQKTSEYNISRLCPGQKLSVLHTKGAARKIQVRTKRLHTLQEALGRPNM